VDLLSRCSVRDSHRSKALLSRLISLNTTILLVVGLPFQASGFQQGGEALESILSDGLALMKSGDFQQAASKFRLAVQASPNSAPAHYNLALALLRLHRETEAADELRRVTVLAPEIAPAHYNLALLLEQNGKLDEAIEQLQACRALNPGDVRTIVHLVNDYFRNGATAQGLGLARQALSQSSDLRFHAQLGVILLENGQAGDALQPLETVLRSAPNALNIVPYLARAYIETGNSVKAEELLRNTVQLHPENSELHFNLGRLLLASSTAEMQQQAIDELNTAIRLSPQTSEYYETLGRSLLERNRLEQAASILKQGLEHVPASVNLNLMLGVAEADLHGTAAAKPYIETALSLDPQAALGYNLLGNLYLRTGEYGDAVQNYKKAAELAPKNDLYAYDVALALERINKIQDAIVYAQKSVSLNPNRSITHYMLGKLYAKLDRPADALRELETCIRLDPGADPPYYLLARIYRKLGDEQKAAQALARLGELKAARDSRVGLSGPATATTTLLDTPAPWDNIR
jgi:tetratricopeptide (TPR) repeat protein